MLTTRIIQIGPAFVGAVEDHNERIVRTSLPYDTREQAYRGAQWKRNALIAWRTSNNS